MRKLIHSFLAITLLFHGTIYAQPEKTETQTSIKQGLSELEFDKKIDSLRESILNKSKNPLDQYQLLTQDFIKPQTNVLKANVKFSFLDAKGEITQESLFRTSDKFYSGAQLSEIQLAHSNKLVHSLKIKTDRIAWNKQFIVWIEKDSASKENINFVDLNFVALGKSELPVFRFPVKSLPKGDMLFKGSNLHIGDKVLSYKQIKDISKLQQVAFSLNVNLLDSKHLENTKEMISEFHELYLELAKQGFEKKRKNRDSNLANQRDVSNLLSSLELGLEDHKNSIAEEIKLLDHLKGDDRNKKIEFIRERINKNQNKSKEFLDKVSQSEKYRESILRAGESRSSHRRLLAKIHEIYLYMSVPRPDGVATLKSAFFHIATGIKEGKSEEFKEAFYDLYSKKYLKITFGVASSVAVGAMFPQEVSHFLLQSLEVGKTLSESIIGKLGDFGYLAKESAKATFSGFSPEVFSSVYIDDGRWAKTLTGLSALVGMMFTTLGLPHLLVNGAKLGSDLKNYDYSKLREEFPKRRHFFKRIIKAFVARQNLEEQNYIKLMQEAEGDLRSDIQVKFSELENEEVRKILEKVRLKDFKESKILKWARSLNSKQEQTDKKFNVETKTMNFRQSLTHFLFSFSSFTNSGVFYTSVWNYWFILRTLTFRPNLWPYLLMYPKFFRVAVLHEAGKVHTPTKWNGGKEMGLSIVSSLMARYKNKNLNDQVIDLERKIVDMEGRISQFVMPRAFKASIAYTQNIKDFELLTKNNISDYTNKYMKSLSFKTKLYFQWYNHIAVEKILERHMSRISGIEFGSDKSKRQMKEEIVRAGVDFNEILNDSEISRLFSKVEEEKSIAQRAKEFSEKSRFNFSNSSIHHLQKTLTSMDSRYSGQFERFAVTEVQMKKPKAVARAVRSTVVKMIIDKPMELAFLFVMVAGVSGGLVEPIHNEMFSENSWFHLSKYQFLKGFAYGMISGLLADSWLKLQQDARVDSLGGFNNVPSGERAKRGFLSNFRTEMQAKDNTWWKNQFYYSKLIWANMGAAFVTMAAIHWVSMGRFDLDVYIAGYLFSFLSPLSGLSYKFENAFEKTSSWVIRDIPKKFRSHPEVIKYSGVAMAKMRVKFNIWYSIYENTLGHFQSNMMNMSTDQLGPRSFSRWVAGGYTFTEALINFTDSMAEKYPILSKPAQACRTVFLNNYTAGVKLNKK